MSDRAPFILIVTEGPHDVEAISRMLSLKGFKEIQKDTDIPEELESMIPRRYPSKTDHRLIRIVPHPTFLVRDGTFITVSNAGGKTRIGENLADIIGNLSQEALSGLMGIALIADMDEDNVENGSKILLEQLYDEIEPTPSIEMDNPLKGSLEIPNWRFPLCLFLLPDNEIAGTLETLLIAGAEQQYPDLLETASAYVEQAKKRYPEHLDGFNELKATVGVISNIFRPGRANQVSIGKDNWITKEGIETIHSHQVFSAFLDSLCLLLPEHK